MRNILILFILVVFPWQVLGDTGDTIKLAAGLAVEPYIIETNDSGFEIDTVRETFAIEGYKVQFVYEPLKRTKVSFRDGTVDGVMTVKTNYTEVQNTFISEEYITYHNTVITLQSRDIKIDTIADLKDKSVVAFQHAQFAFGKDFELMVEMNPKYSEMANQKSQTAMLFMKRIDAIVLDSRIFKYNYIQLRDFPDKTWMKSMSFVEPVTFHDIFEPSSYRVAFKVKTMRDVFNSGLKKIKESGHYIQIIEAYVKD
jgi:polar amino acid transport system substrate-binding protein